MAGLDGCGKSRLHRALGQHVAGRYTDWAIPAAQMTPDLSLTLSNRILEKLTVTQLARWNPKVHYRATTAFTPAPPPGHILLQRIFIIQLNHLTPNGHFSGRTAPLTYRCCIFFIYSTNTRTEYFKHAAHSPFFLFKMPFIS